jgi:flagellar hook assembly protein FlgD
MAGRLVLTLLDDQMARQGLNEIVWNGRDKSGRQVSSGLYFYQFETGKYSESNRVVLIK